MFGTTCVASVLQRFANAVKDKIETEQLKHTMRQIKSITDKLKLTMANMTPANHAFINVIIS